MSTWKIHPEINYYYRTNTVVEWYPIFLGNRYFDIVVDSLTYCRNWKGLRVHAYVIMFNHMHLIISSASQLAVSDLMRDLKRHTSVALSTLLEERNNQLSLDLFCREARVYGASWNYKVWQDGFHPIGIYTGKYFIQKLNNNHQNLARKGYVLKPEHWFYSSAGNYAGYGHNAMEIDFLE